MKTKTVKRELTEQEWDLIEMIRDYQKSFPNGYPRLLWEIQKLFDEMVDLPKD